MKKKTKKLTALFLSLCMMASLITAIPAKAGNLNTALLGTVSYEVENYREPGMRANGDVNFYWDEDAQRDLISGLNAGSNFNSGTCIIPGEEKINFFAYYNNGSLSAMTGAATITRIKDPSNLNDTEPVTDGTITVTPVEGDAFAADVSSTGYYRIKASKDAKCGAYFINIGEESLWLDVFLAENGWFDGIPDSEKTLQEKYIADRFRYTKSKRTVYFVYKEYYDWQVDDEDDDNSYYKTQFKFATYSRNEEGESFKPSKDDKIIIYTERDNEVIEVNDEIAVVASMGDRTIAGEKYVVVEVELGENYTGEGLFIPIVNVNYSYDDTEGEAVPDEEQPYNDGRKSWLNCVEAGIAVNDSPQDSGWQTKLISTWVQDPGEDPREFRLFWDGGDYTKDKLYIRFADGGEKEEIPFKDGVFSYSFDKIGSYIIYSDAEATDDDYENTARIYAMPRPVDFYKHLSYWHERITSDNILWVKGATKSNSLAFCFNDDCTGWDEKSQKEIHYNNLNVTLRLYAEGQSEPTELHSWEEEDATAYNNIIKPDEENGWYTVDVDANTYDWFEVELEAQVVKDGEDGEGQIIVDNFNRSIHVDIIPANEYVFAFLPEDPDQPFEVSKNINNVRARYENPEFLIAEVKVNEEGYVTYNPLEEVDTDKLHVFYHTETEPLCNAIEDGLASVSVVKKEVGEGQLPFVTVHFDAEGRDGFNIVYGNGDEGVYVGNISPTQEGFAVYKSDHRPTDFEKIEYDDGGTLDCKERQGDKSINLFAWTWDSKSQNEFKDKLNNAKPTVASAVKYVTAEKEDQTLWDPYDVFLMMNNMDSLTVTATNKAGKAVNDYVVVKDIVDDGGFVVGKNISVSSKACEDFTIKATMATNAYLVDQELKKSGKDWKRHYIDWAVEGGGPENDSITYAVKVSPFTGIKVTTTPSKVSYTEGDKLDTTGIAVAGVYADGTTYPLTAADFTVSPAAALTTADKKATVTYKNLTASYDITVAAKPAEQPTTPAPATPAPAEVGQTITDTSGAAKGETFTVTGTGDNATVTYAGQEAGNTATTLVIPDAVVGADGKEYAVTEIASNALKGNTTVEEVKTGKNIKKIGSGAFQNATNLKKATLGKSVSEIGANAFSGCKKLTTVKCTSKTVKTIGANAFKGTALKSADFGKSKITTIGANAFGGCKKLTKVKFDGAKIKKVGKGAIPNSGKVTVIIKGNKKQYNSVKKLFKKAGIKKVKFKKA